MRPNTLTSRVEWDRNVVERLNALGLPDEAAREFTAKLRRYANFPEILRRRSRATAWMERATCRYDDTLESNGYVDLTTQLQDRAQKCVSVLRQHVENVGTKNAKSGKKAFLVEMMTPELLEGSPEILGLILADEILDQAIGYLGTVPVLQNIALSWTPANETLSKSQLFHIDHIDKRQLKFSMNVSDVSLANGPFTFITAPQSDQIVSDWQTREKDYKRGERIPDKFIIERVPADKWIQAIGPSGTIVGADTCRCLHCGARTRKGSRVTLRFNFTRRDSHRMFKFFAPPAVIEQYKSDPVRALILNM